MGMYQNNGFRTLSINVNCGKRLAPDNSLTSYFKAEQHFNFTGISHYHSAENASIDNVIK